VRWWRVAGPIVLGGVAVGSLAFALPPGTGLRFTGGTPKDLRAVASDTWERFSRATPACGDRLGAVTVGVAWGLPDRARYEPGPALVLIRAPGTAANLEATLLHEFAHHAEYRCGLSPRFRRGFTATGGQPPDTPWLAGPTWEATPSERFAEAMVVHVLGHRPPHVLIHLRPAELEAAAAWADGG
jgi:hypothetical protein